MDACVTLSRPKWARAKAPTEECPNLPLEGRSKSGEQSEMDFGRGANAPTPLPPPGLFLAYGSTKPDLPSRGRLLALDSLGVRVVQRNLPTSFAAAVLLGLTTLLTDPALAAPINNPVAEFTGLDKITGRTITFDVAIDETVQFGALQVTPRVCHTRPPTEPAQTTAFVEVDEITLANKIQRIFTGWMFAASPGLHAIEHPVYDVWLVDCKVAMGETKSPDAAPEPEPELPTVDDEPED